MVSLINTEDGLCVWSRTDSKFIPLKSLVKYYESVAMLYSENGDENIMEDKYLRVTIHDNDFSLSLEWVGDLLYKIFYTEDHYPTEEQLPKIKEYIKRMWHSAHVIQDIMRWDTDGGHNDDCEYFNPRLEFVNAGDIPDWDNRESIYIPMFDDGKILVR